MTTADEILASIQTPHRGNRSRLEEWEERNPEAAAKFWDVIQRGYKRCDGMHEFTPLYRAFRDAYPDFPKMIPSNMKRCVDARLDADR